MTLQLTSAAATPIAICSLVLQFNGVFRGSAKNQLFITKPNLAYIDKFSSKRYH